MVATTEGALWCSFRTRGVNLVGEAGRGVLTVCIHRMRHHISNKYGAENSPETVLATLRVVALLLIFAFGRKVLGSLRGEGGLDISFREGGLEGGLNFTVGYSRRPLIQIKLVEKGGGI